MKTDIIVIGAGPAGISAGIYAKSRGLDVTIIERERVGGVIGNVSTVTHYSAIMQHETGESFALRMKKQAENADIRIVYENVKETALLGELKKVQTDKDTYEAPAVIIANGSTPRKLGIPGEKQFSGHGIGMNAAKHGLQYAGRNIYVVGGADGAIKEAIYLAQFAKEITIIHFEEKLGTIAEFRERLKKLPNVKIRLRSRLTAVSGKQDLDTLEITNIETGETDIIHDDGCGIFVYAGLIPNTDLYPQLDLENGFIPANEKMETSIPGVYAVGDIRVKQIRQAATAVADGAIAGINAASYLLTVSA